MQVQNVTNKLQELFEENQQELVALAAQLKEKCDQLNTESTNFGVTGDEGGKGD